jgi:hypothetical protein
MIVLIDCFTVKHNRRHLSSSCNPSNLFVAYFITATSVFTSLDRLIMNGWQYVSEPLPPTSLLFIPRVICESREPWWSWCRLGINPDSSARALWQSYQQRHLRQVRGMDEGVRILPISIWSASRDLWHAVKSYDMGPPTLLPIRNNVCCGF